MVRDRNLAEEPGGRGGKSEEGDSQEEDERGVRSRRGWRHEPTAQSEHDRNSLAPASIVPAIHRKRHHRLKATGCATDDFTTR